jgi:NADPH:quinone reductase-like Zn-dependent oxidoreductase
MEAIRISQYVNSVEQLTVSTVKQPLPSKDKILIKIDCAAANFFDILQVQGKYQTQPPFPWIAGFEFAGTVVESFPGAPYAVGDRVFGGAQGAYAEYISLDPSKTPVLPIPDGMSFEEASTLFVTAPTSYLALVNRAQCKAGEIVLVHAGAGGVGLMAVQIAKACGSVVIATASSAEKLQVCREFGADYAINYKSDNWIEEVKKITKGKGCDVIYDPVGMVDASLKVIAWNGRILVVGFAAGEIEKIAMNKLLLKQCTVMGVYWGGTTVKDPQTVPAVWMGILNMIQEGQLKAPVFSRIYQGLSSIPEALSALGNRETWGKVVIKIAKQSKL